MQQYRKKPIIIEAVQATLTPDSNRDIIAWTRDSHTSAYMDKNADGVDQLSINTKEGTLWVSVGDWIIRGICGHRGCGEFYPCKPDIFDKTYEKLI